MGHSQGARQQRAAGNVAAHWRAAQLHTPTGTRPHSTPTPTHLRLQPCPHAHTCTHTGTCPHPRACVSKTASFNCIPYSFTGTCPHQFTCVSSTASSASIMACRTRSALAAFLNMSLSSSSATDGRADGSGWRRTSVKAASLGCTTWHARVCVRAYVCARMHARVCVCVRECTRMCVRMCVRVCTRVCVRMCVSVLVCVCVHMLSGHMLSGTCASAENDAASSPQVRRALRATIAGR